MGNLFITKRYKHQECVCMKCNVNYKPSYGSYSKHRSCRYHSWENNECHYCDAKLNNNTSNNNCYHYKKESCWDWL